MMYEEIRKPKLLKDVPTSLIRALPTLYYTNKFSRDDLDERINILYNSNVVFLSNALKEIGHQLQNNDFSLLAVEANELKGKPSADLFQRTQDFSEKLATVCSLNREALRKNNHEIKSELTTLYPSLVNTLNVLLIDNSCGKQNISKVAGTLKNLCFYHVDQTEPASPDFSSKLLASDFALFYCISSPEIHKQVNSLTTYHIPGLAMMQIDKDVALNQEAIRHGAQLTKIGFCVLYKMFTPIRLFTTIDKTFLQYNLQERH
jgi:hypothetical protein